MQRVPVGWEDQLAALRHVLPQFPTGTRHIWQRLNAGYVKNNCNVRSNRSVKSNCKKTAVVFANLIANTTAAFVKLRVLLALI